MGAESKHRYRTPGPGAYDVRTASLRCSKSAPKYAFGGSLNRVDRGKTGPLKVLGEKEFVPGPCTYAFEAREQARKLCERPHALIFGRASRDDIAKLFLGKDAVAYITSRTPGPCTYELGWQRPVCRIPVREPGTSIGGPLANVDRVRTGPLGAACRSDTPGPGAYDETNDSGMRTTLTLRMPGCNGLSSVSSGTESRGANKRGFIAVDNTGSRLGLDSDVSSWGGRGRGVRNRGFDDHSWPGTRDNDPFSLSPFRFVDLQGQDSWQLPCLGVKLPTTTPSRRKHRPSEAEISRSRGMNRSRERFTHSKGSAPPRFVGDSRSSSGTRPVTTFGTGTREQAAHVIAPGFKGCTTWSTSGIPGPGAYRNVPGAMGQQVVSTLFSSPANTFGQSSRGLRGTRDGGVPGPGSYKVVSSLGNQISSRCATSPQPTFGTSVRRALEDGLVG